jgi:hypothetical protein
MIDEVERILLPAISAIPPPWNLSRDARSKARVYDGGFKKSPELVATTFDALEKALEAVAHCPPPEPSSPTIPGQDRWGRPQDNLWMYGITELGCEISDVRQYSRTRVAEVLHAVSPQFDPYVDLACEQWLHLHVMTVASHAARWLWNNLRAESGTPEAAKLLSLAEKYDQRVPEGLSLVVISAAARVAVGAARSLLERIAADPNRSGDAHEQMGYLLDMIDNIENPPPPGHSRMIL